MNTRLAAIKRPPRRNPISALAAGDGFPLLIFALILSLGLTLPPALGAQQPAEISPPSSADPSSGPSQGRFLLHLRGVPIDAGGALWIDDLWLFHDGLAILSRAALGPEARVLRVRVAPEALDALRAILVTEEVGFQTGSCDLPEIDFLQDLEGVEERRFELSWFGRGDRSRHLRLAWTTPAVTPVYGRGCSAGLSRITAGALALFAEAFSLPEGPAEEPAGRQRLLLEIRNNYLSKASCGLSYDEDVLIFRDGLVLRRAGTGSGKIWLQRTAAADVVRDRLGSALVANQVGHWGGTCEASFFLPFLILADCTSNNWQSASTWYGNGDRNATLVGFGESTRTCSSAQESLQQEILQFLRGALAGPATQSVSGSFPGS